MRISLLLVVLLTSGLGSVATAQETPEENAQCLSYSNAATVFVGRMLGSTRVTLKVNWGLGGGEETLRRMRFSVEESFKGAQAQEIDVLTRLEPTCGRDFKEGERYLIYAYSWARQPELRTSFCGRTRHVSEAGADIAYLRALLTGAPVASLHGKVEQYSLDLIKSELHLVRALPGVTVIAEGEGKRFETRTDSAGKYHFGELVAGTYRVRVVPPAHLYSAVLNTTAELKWSGCGEADFRFQTDGRVGGHVLDADGQPAPRVSLALVPLENLKPDDAHDPAPVGLVATADNEGRYEFEGVPPGRYLLGVNLGWGAPTVVGREAFPRTFYPGTPDRAEATIIVLAEGEKQLEHDLQLPPRLVERWITGSVVLADGTPAVCAVVGLIDPTLAGRWQPISQGVDEQGRFSLGGYDGYKYAVQARVTMFDKDGQSNGDVSAPMVEVMASESNEPVQFTIPPPANCNYMLKRK
jgi:hypothetical protein